MPPETELIKQQMGQTRADLTAKLETLENQVLGTVRDTTSTVSQTVQQVSSTVRETVQDVRATVRETSSSVRDALDVSRQMQQHPWLMLGGSVALGYVGGCLLDSLEAGRSPLGGVMPAAPERLLPADSELRERMEARPAAGRTGFSFLKALAETFAPELDRLKKFALGAAVGMVRDRLGEAVPPQFQHDFADLMDRVTTKLGGQPTPPGSLRGESEEHDGPSVARSMGIG
jgi:ElaB/YqjD/DUF883 family membrane-anchored ribosome-binding protein